MQVREAGPITHLISDDEYIGYRILPHTITDRIDQAVTYGFARNRRIFEAIGEFADSNLSGIKVVHAHGLRDVRGWMYQDGRVRKFTQHLVDDLDGSARAILIFACNPANFEIRSRQSIVMHPRGRTKFVTHWLFGAGLRLYLPGRGYID